MASTEPQNTSETVHNILLLGETQAGKSTLLEFFKKYANEQYGFDYSLIGNGSNSHTAVISQASFTTNLPPYYVDHDIPNPEGKGTVRAPIDYGEFINEEDPEDYEDRLNDAAGRTLRRGTVDTHYRFNVIDAPGLNDTSSRDEGHILKIFETLYKVGSISLVVIVLRRGAFTPAVRDAIQSYIDLFPDLRGNIVFLHAHVDYKELHRTNLRFEKYINDKKALLNGIVGDTQTSLPHYLIDCNLAAVAPIRICITYNTIRSILKTATFAKPVAVGTMTLRKSKRMIDIDEYLVDAFSAQLQIMEATLRNVCLEEGEMLAKVIDLDNRILEKEKLAGIKRRYLLEHDDDKLVQVYMNGFNEAWHWNKSPEIYRYEYYPNLPKYKIALAIVWKQNAKQYYQEGGKGESFYKTAVRRTRYQNGEFQVRLYVPKRLNYRKPIDECTDALGRLLYDIKALRNEHDRVSTEAKKAHKVIGDLEDSKQRLNHVRTRATYKNIEPELFHRFVREGAFLVEPAEAAGKVEAIYRELYEADQKKDFAPPAAQRVEEGDVKGEVTLDTVEDEGESINFDEDAEVVKEE